LVQNKRVDHRRPNVLVAQQFLYGANVLADASDWANGEVIKTDASFEFSFESEVASTSLS
jgi:hypothetical protein